MRGAILLARFAAAALLPGTRGPPSSAELACCGRRAATASLASLAFLSPFQALADSGPDEAALRKMSEANTRLNDRAATRVLDAGMDFATRGVDAESCSCLWRCGQWCCVFRHRRRAGLASVATSGNRGATLCRRCRVDVGERYLFC